MLPCCKDWLVRACSMHIVQELCTKWCVTVNWYVTFMGAYVTLSVMIYDWVLSNVLAIVLCWNSVWSPFHVHAASHMWRWPSLGVPICMVDSMTLIMLWWTQGFIIWFSFVQQCLFFQELKHHPLTCACSMCVAQDLCIKWHVRVHCFVTSMSACCDRLRFSSLMKQVHCIAGFLCPC